MSDVTIFPNITKVSGGQDIGLDDIMAAVKDGDWKDKVQHYRDLPNESEADIIVRKKAKKKFPYFTGSGTFTSRKDKGLKKHNGRIILDIDEVEDVDEAKSLICGDQYTEYCFRSLGGEGLAVVVKIDPDTHLNSWKALVAYYKKNLNLVVDKSTKDVSRARFISYDPDLYHNPKAKKFQMVSYSQIVKERTKNIIESAGKGEVHNSLIRASRLMGGYIAGGVIDHDDGEAFIVDLMSRKSGVVSMDIEKKKIAEGIANGKLVPITKRQIKTNEEESEEDRRKWREIYGFIFNCNKMGRPWHEEDIKQLCELHLVDADKVRRAFQKIYKENKDEYGLNDKSDLYKVEHYLNKNWNFARNEVTQLTEFKRVDAEEYVPLNPDTIFRKMQHANFKYGFEKLKSLFKSDFVPTYNPFIRHFEELDLWDEKEDHIAKLASYVTTDNQKYFEVQFKKHLVRCVGCSLYGRENRIVFTMIGEKQDAGKSTFIRFLNPFGKLYYTEAPMGNSKDTYFAMSENFIYNIEELASLSNIDVNKLKSIISMVSVKERKNYEVNAEAQPRRANLFASSNKGEFLTDSENTRWLVFNITAIDWAYSQEIDIDKIWSQAFALYKDKSFNDQLTKEEALLRDNRNRDYEINDYEKELIKRHFQTVENNEGEFYSNADILDVLRGDSMANLNMKFIGKHMIQLGFKKTSKKLNGHAVRGYFAKKIVSEYKEDVEKIDEKPF